MKRMLAILLSAALLLGLLPACSPQGVKPSDPPAEETEEVSAVPAPEEPRLNCLLVMMSILMLDPAPAGAESMYNADYANTDHPERLPAYIESAYGLTAGEWADGTVTKATDGSAFELAVLYFADEDAAKHGEDCLRDYLRTREGDFAGHAPDQARLVADAALCRQGLYVGLFICPGNHLLESSFTTIIETGKVPELPEPAQDAAELLDRFLIYCELHGDAVFDLERVDGSDPNRLKSIVDGEYGLADYPWTDAAIARGTGGNVFEIAILHMDCDEDAGFSAIEGLNAYLNAKEEACARFHDQAELLHNAIGAWSHSYIALLVCNDPTDTALQLGRFLGYTGKEGGFSYMRRYKEDVPEPAIEHDPDYPDRAAFVRPGKEDMSIYDTSAIRAAWAGGDPSGLSEHDRETYDAAKAILGEILADGMTDLEKETAIYRWLVYNVNYDWRHQDVLTETPRESYEPYGGLVDLMAVCLGYAASFQLLMELSGMECITVVGASFNNQADHAWNMVRLDGKWYCVDVTWEANAREQSEEAGFDWPEEYWNFFNLTSDEMAKEHQWDYANTPEAVTEGRGKG